MREVAVLLESQPANHTDAVTEAEARANFLQEKLNSSYDVVAGLVKELQQARGMITQVHDQNLNLQKRMLALEEGMKEEKAEDSPMAAWMYGVGVFLYAMELNQFLLAGLLYMWLSQNFVAADAMKASIEKDDDDVSISKIDV